jgi:hypothetical protein
MRKYLRTAAIFVFAFVVMSSAHAQNATFRVLAFWTTGGEVDHSDFARQAIEFFSEAAGRDHFEFRATTDWKEMNPETLAKTRVVVWLNGQPDTAEERAAFESYMTMGAGGWERTSRAITIAARRGGGLWTSSGGRCSSRTTGLPFLRRCTLMIRHIRW